MEDLAVERVGIVDWKKQRVDTMEGLNVRLLNKGDGGLLREGRAGGFGSSGRCCRGQLGIRG